MTTRRSARNKKNKLFHFKAIDFDKDENKSETGGTEVKKTKEENDENLEEDNDYIDSSGYFDSGDVGGGGGGDGGDWFDNWFSD